MSFKRTPVPDDHWTRCYYCGKVMGHKDQVVTNASWMLSGHEFAHRDCNSGYAVQVQWPYPNYHTPDISPFRPSYWPGAERLLERLKFQNELWIKRVANGLSHGIIELEL